MEQVFTINCRALTLILLFVTLNTCQANSVEYKKAGSKLVLRPGSVDAPITSITWKHNSNLAVEWYGQEIDFYLNYKGRFKLNTATGELTFPDLSLEDSGSYTPEINNKVLNPTEIKVISEVLTPTVSESCDAEKTHCVLTCEGITTDAGPVVYTWWSGDEMKSETKELKITKEEKSSFFTCKMLNPVSTKSSKQVVNPVLIYNADIYKKVGNEVILSTGPVTDLTTVIVWKHGSNIVVEWFGDTIEYLTDRCTLNTTTGELTISNLTLEDSGSYTAEINDRVMNTTKILVISEVPTPTVSESCDAEKTHCVLTCEGITTDAEPVTYTWWSGDVMKSQTKELNITKEEKDPWFICKLENPVSFESSKEVLNPFITSSSSNTGYNNNNLYWLFILLVVPVVGVIVGFFIYKRRTGKLPPLPTHSSFKTKAVAADSSQASPNHVHEEKPLLNGDKGVVQGSSNPENINETDVQVTSLQEEKTDESTGTNNEPENSSEKSVVNESPPDFEKTTVTPNSEALNPKVEETPANEN